MKNILITGAAGFIGSNFALYMQEKYQEKYQYIILDKLTYAADMQNLDKMKDYTFIKKDICDVDAVEQVIRDYNVDAIVHFAAESHVDNSIKDPFVFMKTNVIGTQSMLEAAQRVWGDESSNRFVHVSTDEVYGALGETGYFTELTPIAPNSPYSSSKAGSDLVARAYCETYKMNVCITRCSNNYGPNQHDEKLIPHMIKLALEDKQLPVYGNGLNVRDWLFVVDHCSAIDAVLHNGKMGEVYNIGGNNEKNNLYIVKTILQVLGKPESLITFVEDRKGHDFRYAIDSTKMQTELDWKPSVTFEEGILYTIKHYEEKFSK